MQAKKYIKELKNHLSSLDNNKRDEIIKEIQSYVDESNVSYEELENKFGNAEKLAASYLNSHEPVKLKKASLTDKILITMGVIFLILVLGAGYLAYKFTSDEFDYSKFNETTIIEKTKKNWKKLENIQNIKIEQSKVIFYWSKDIEAKFTCEGPYISNDKNTLKIKQSSCYVIMPKNKVNINGFQSSLILIEPKQNVSLDLKQVSVNIFENKQAYMYDFEEKESKIKDLISKKSDIKISGKLFQSELNKYEY